MTRNFIKAAGGDLPVALLALAFFLTLLFQAVQLVREGGTLAAIDRGQDTALQETQRLRQAADSLAADVALLAQSGNANAKQVVDDMARQNVILRPPPAADADKAKPDADKAK